MIRQLLKLFFAISLLSNIIIASEKTEVCAKYETQNGWSKGYSVQATIIQGSELNSVTRSFNYNVVSKYVVIFWDQDEASVIELDMPFLGPLGQTGKDQQDRQWEIAETNICF